MPLLHYSSLSCVCVCFTYSVYSNIFVIILSLSLFVPHTHNREKEIRKFTFTEFTIMCIRPGEKGDKSASQVLRAFEVSHGSYKCVLIVSYEVRTHTRTQILPLCSVSSYAMSCARRTTLVRMYVHAYVYWIRITNAPVLRCFGYCSQHTNETTARIMIAKHPCPFIQPDQSLPVSLSVINRCFVSMQRSLTETIASTSSFATRATV